MSQLSAHKPLPGWTLTAELLPPQDVVVETMAHEEAGTRPLQLIIRQWWTPEMDGMAHYTPKYWRAKRKEQSK